MQPRTPQNDQRALTLTTKAIQYLTKYRNKRKEKSKASGTRQDGATTSSDSVSPVSENGQPKTQSVKRHLLIHPKSSSQENEFAYGIDNSIVRLPLKSMYDGHDHWPKNVGTAGAIQYSWGNISFPKCESLIIPDFESDTHIDPHNTTAVSVSLAIADIKNRPASEIADAGTLTVEEEHERRIETFKIRGYTVAKVTVMDADIHEKRGAKYSGTKIAKMTEKATTNAMGVANKEPDLDTIRWVAAQVLLAKGGQIGGPTGGYFRRARGLAQEQLYLNPDLEASVREQQSADRNDPSFKAMLETVKLGLPTRAPNPYYQSQRNDCAVANELLYRIKDTDIVMVLDRNGQVIAFQYSEGFQLLLGQEVMEKVVCAFETYSTLQGVPIPDMTRHSHHWIEWLRERPDLDFRRPENDPRVAKSGVYHFGAKCEIGDSNGTKGPHTSQDSEARAHGSRHITVQNSRLRYNALGACTEVVKFFFQMLDPELFAEYLSVSKTLSEMEAPIKFETRRQGQDPFTMKALLVNSMTYEHKDKSDWIQGFAGLVPLGDYTGGDLLLRELGLLLESKPGSVQLLRGRELRHSITKYAAGRRFVPVLVTHEAVRRFARAQNPGRTLDENQGENESALEGCLDVQQEDVLPEDQEVLDSPDRIPERYVGLEITGPNSDSSEQAEQSEASTTRPDQVDVQVGEKYKHKLHKARARESSSSAAGVNGGDERSSMKRKFKSSPDLIDAQVEEKQEARTRRSSSTDTGADGGDERPPSKKKTKCGHQSSSYA